MWAMMAHMYFYICKDVGQNGPHEKSVLKTVSKMTHVVFDIECDMDLDRAYNIELGRCGPKWPT